MTAAILILLLVGVVLAGMDYDLLRLRDEVAADDEIGAGSAAEDALPICGPVASLTAAGADTPYDWANDLDYVSESGIAGRT